MKKLLGPAVLLLLCSLPTFAQGTPVGEVGFGYTFRNWGSPAFLQPPSSLHMNGWNATADFNINKWIGVATDVDWTRNSQNVGNVDITTVLIGPQVYPLGHHRLTPYVHALFGVGYFNVSFPSSTDCAPFCTLTDGNFAWAGGGGVDWTVTKHLAVRLGQFDYEQTRFGLQVLTQGPAVPTQDNWKYSAGILIRFGER
jgi:opacity protein-like surface antigen